MADVAQVTDEQVQQETSHRPHERTFQPEQLVSSMWGVEQPKIEQTQQAQTEQPKTEPAVTPATPEPPKTEEPKEEVFDENIYIKNNYGFDSPEALKQTVEEYKKLKEQVPQEQKWENEESKKVYELLRQGKIKEVTKYFSDQEQIDKYSSAEVNSATAEEIIKLGMKLSNDRLTKEDIDFKYKQEYGTPKQPTQRVTETEDEFAERMEEWKERVSDLEMKRVVDAKMAIPQLEQLKHKIVLPEIETKQVVNHTQPTQEELDAMKKYNDAYVQSSDASVKNFNGFSVKVKNEDVGIPEITIPYVVVDAEKNSLSQQMRDFVNSNYDANALFADRWVNEDNSLNTQRMAEDRYLLDNRDKIFQKLAEESATKAVEEFIKGKKKININETQTTQTQTFENEKSDFDKIRDSFFG